MQTGWSGSGLALFCIQFVRCAPSLLHKPVISLPAFVHPGQGRFISR